MSTLLQNISKGKRKALIQSFEENKDRIYNIATKIDKSQASKATIWAFKNVWNDIISKSGLNDEDFLSLVIKKLAAYMQRNSNNASKDTLSTCQELSNSYNGSEISVPTEVDKAVYDFINRIAAPVENHDKKTYVIFGIIALVVIACVVALVIFLSGSDESDVTGINTSYTSNDGNTNNSDNMADVQIPIPEISADIDATLDYYADIIIKDYGTITVKLEPTHAPITVANFVGLAESDFYDGLTFHRIMEGFMMQGGDPLGNGTGGSEEKIFGEFATNGFKNVLSHTRGAISMARAYENNSASSQFFIMHEDDIRLDGNYAVFGYVTEGIEIVDAICEDAKPVDDNGTILAKEQPVIDTITIRTQPIETKAE